MTIAAVADKYGLTPDTLRYYERVGLIPPVPRTPGGMRDYGQDDCQWIEFIKCMRLAGLPVDVLAEYVELYRQGDGTLPRRKQLLREQRETLVTRIADMRETLRRLDVKIAHYDQITVPVENSADQTTTDKETLK